MNDEKIKLIYDQVKNVTGRHFETICFKIIRSFKHAPNVSDFIELIGSTPKLVRIISGCGICENGIVSTKCKERGLDYVWKCSCEAGQSRQETYPIWDKSFEEKYTRE